MHTTHPLPPVYDANSRILILGSFPSVKSREVGFFYGHPQNRFWSMLSTVLGEPLPQTVEEKEALLLCDGIALWDVIASCEITGSADQSIKNAVPNNLLPILQQASIRAVYTNGATAHRLYRRYLQQQTGLEATCLPSTSAANAAWSLLRLVDAWNVIRACLAD